MRESTQELPDAVDRKLVSVVIVVLVSGVEARLVVEVPDAIETYSITPSRSERPGHGPRNGFLPLLQGVAYVRCVPTVRCATVAVVLVRAVDSPPLRPSARWPRCVEQRRSSMHNVCRDVQLHATSG